MQEFLDKIKAEISSTVAIDFDGVLHQYSEGFKDGTIYDKPAENTKDALKYLSSKYDLVIFTCRANPERPLVNGKTGSQLIWDWLEEWKLAQYITKVTHIKPRALFYIDDKGITFHSWAQVIFEMNRTEDLAKKDLTKY
jgi:hypothetical protein